MHFDSQEDQNQSEIYSFPSASWNASDTSQWTVVKINGQTCICQNCHISRPCRDAQDRLLWRDKTCHACAYLIMSWKALLVVISCQQYVGWFGRKTLSPRLQRAPCNGEQHPWHMSKRHAGITLPHTGNTVCWHVGKTCISLQPRQHTILPVYDKTIPTCTPACDWHVPGMLGIQSETRLVLHVPSSSWAGNRFYYYLLSLVLLSLIIIVSSRIIIIIIIIIVVSIVVSWPWCQSAEQGCAPQGLSHDSGSCHCSPANRLLRQPEYAAQPSPWADSWAELEKSGLCQLAEDLEAKQSLFCMDAETIQTWLVSAWCCICLEWQIMLLTHAVELSSELLWWDQGVADQQRTWSIAQRYDEDTMSILSSWYDRLQLVCIAVLQNQLSLPTLHCCKYMQESWTHESQDGGVITGITIWNAGSVNTFQPSRMMLKKAEWLHSLKMVWWVKQLHI